jgi:protein-disulfide isomerase
MRQKGGWTCGVLGWVLVLELLTGCQPSPDQLGQVLKEHPDIVLEALKSDMTAFSKVVGEAQQFERNRMMAERSERQKRQQEMEMQNPKTPVIESHRVIQGKKDAGVTVVVYSDFQCPFCKRGHDTIRALLKKQPEGLRVVYKHLPLPNHPMALPGAQYFESIAKQDPQKALQFYDAVFDNQSKLGTEGEKYFERLAKDLKVNLGKLLQDRNSQAVQSQIQKDMAEARSFGLTGTPSYLVNGVSLRGAVSIEDFESLIERVKPK